MPFVDYMTFTWKSDVATTAKGQMRDFWEAFPELAAWRDSREVVEMDSLRSYYTNSFVLDPVSQFVVWYSAFNMSQDVMVNVPSSAVYEIAQLLGDGTVPDGEVIPSYKVEAMPIVSKIVERGGKFTRLDIAHDDYSKKFTPRDLMEYWLSGQVSTPARFARCVASKQSGSDTFYLGKRGSERMLRVYDKAAESQGEIDAVRWEFEYRGEKAQAVALSIANGNSYSMQLELLGDKKESKKDGHVGFLVIKEYGVKAKSAGGLSPEDAAYQYEHEKKSDSAIVSAWEEFVKHELKVPDQKEPVYISTKRSASHIYGKLRNIRNIMGSVCEMHVITNKAGMQDIYANAWEEAFERCRAECRSETGRLRIDELVRELRDFPEAIEILN